MQRTRRFSWMVLIILVSISLIDECQSAVFDYPLKCTWWTWGLWDRRNCLHMGDPMCVREKRKKRRNKQVMWIPKYGQKPCSGRAIDYRPCSCLPPEALMFITPPKQKLNTFVDWIEDVLYAFYSTPLQKWIFGGK